MASQLRRKRTQQPEQYAPGLLLSRLCAGMWFWLPLLLSSLTVVRAQVLQSNNTECRLLTYIPFTDIRPGAPGPHANPGSYGYGFWPSADALAKNAFSLLAAAELARRDFNARNPVLVPELPTLTHNCAIQLSQDSVYADSQYSRQTVVSDFLERQYADETASDNAANNEGDPRPAILREEDLFSRRHLQPSTRSTAARWKGQTQQSPPKQQSPLGNKNQRTKRRRKRRSLEEEDDEDGMDKQLPSPQASRFCSVVGPVEDEAHRGLAIVTERFGIPQVAYQTIQSDLSRRDRYPTFVRAIPEGRDFGRTLARLIYRDVWQRPFVAILYEPDYGNQFEGPIDDLEDELEGVFFGITEELVEGDDESLYEAMEEMVEEGYRTIIYAGDRFEILDDVARVAHEFGLLGDGYVWILAGDAFPPAMRQVVRLEPGSPLDLLLNGAALFTNYDAYFYEAESAFVDHWRQQSSQLVADLVQNYQPRHPDNGTVFYEAAPTYFQDEFPAEYSSFMYDAVIAVGVSACQAAAAELEDFLPQEGDDGDEEEDGDGDDEEEEEENGDDDDDDDDDEEEARGDEEEEEDDDYEALSQYVPHPKHVRALFNTTFTGASGTFCFKFEGFDEGEEEDDDDDEDEDDEDEDDRRHLSAHRTTQTSSPPQQKPQKYFLRKLNVDEYEEQRGDEDDNEDEEGGEDDEDDEDDDNGDDEDDEDDDNGDDEDEFEDEDDVFSNTRDPRTVIFGFHNIRPSAVGDDGKRGYDAVLFATYRQEHTFMESDGEVGYGAWKVLPGEEYRFFGNTTVEPMPVATVANANYLSEGIQRTGFSLVAISAAINLGTMAWLFIFRKRRFVKAGQPEFLHMLCIGSLLVSTSLVFISFDENQGWSQDQLNRGCATLPWLVVTGYLTMYCALMSKLWRLSKLMQLRRKVVKVIHVLGPFAVLILCSFVVLTVWQVKDPFQWKRDIISDDPLETYGSCQVVDGSLLAYIVPLGFLIIIVTVSTATFAWKLKDVQSDLSESRWIFFGIFTHLQTWAVGVPIVVITDDTSRDAGYIMLAGLSFIFSTTMVVFVIWPKIFEWLRDKNSGDYHGARSVVIATRGAAHMRISGISLPNRSGFEGGGSARRIQKTDDGSIREGSSRQLPKKGEMPNRNDSSESLGMPSGREPRRQEKPPALLPLGPDQQCTSSSGEHHSEDELPSTPGGVSGLQPATASCSTFQLHPEQSKHAILEEFFDDNDAVNTDAVRTAEESQALLGRLQRRINNLEEYIRSQVPPGNVGEKLTLVQGPDALTSNPEERPMKTTPVSISNNYEMLIESQAAPDTVDDNRPLVFLDAQATLNPDHNIHYAE